MSQDEDEGMEKRLRRMQEEARQRIETMKENLLRQREEALHRRSEAVQRLLEQREDVLRKISEATQRGEITRNARLKMIQGRQSSVKEMVETGRVHRLASLQVERRLQDLGKHVLDLRYTNLGEAQGEKKIPASREAERFTEIETLVSVLRGQFLDDVTLEKLRPDSSFYSKIKEEATKIMQTDFFKSIQSQLLVKEEQL